MQRKRQQSLVIPFVVLGVCLFAFGIPYLFFRGVDDSRDDIVLAPRFTPTPTPLDRILTQQAFADLFFTDTAMPILAGIPIPSSTEVLLVSIPITGATATYTPTVTPTRTPTRTLIPIFPTRTSSGGGGFIPSATPTSPPPTSTATKPPPTSTASKPSPTSTPIVVVTVTSSSIPPTETPIPPPTNTSIPLPTNTPIPPPTNTPIPPPTNTSIPPPTNTPEPPVETPTVPPSGGNGTKPGDVGVFALILLLLAPVAVILPNRLV